jgi:hypothetical protein
LTPAEKLHAELPPRVQRLHEAPVVTLKETRRERRARLFRKTAS